MKRILLTGISGVGKSTIIGELAQRGYTAIDLDGDDYSQWAPLDGDIAAAAGTPVEAGRDWIWRADRVERLLSTTRAEVLFVSGCAPNMRRFLPQFDHVILLTAPAPLIVERLRTRNTNDYGKHPDEIARVLELKESVEPLLRRAASHAIDSAMPLDDVVAVILRIAGCNP